MSRIARIWRPPALGLAAALALTTAAQAATLQERIALCSGCHGEDGNSKIEKIPSLAGQPAFFILNELFLMREGVRKVDAMASFVKELSDKDLDGLSKHFAALPTKPSDEKADAELAKKGAAIATQRGCESCHLPDLAGQQQIPRLAKQRIDYLIAALKTYRDALRPGGDTAMSANVAGATDDDIKALANYAASK